VWSSNFVLTCEDSPIISRRLNRSQKNGCLPSANFSHFQPWKFRFSSHRTLSGHQTHQSRLFLPHHLFPFPKLSLVAENYGFHTHPSPESRMRPHFTTSKHSSLKKKRSPLCLAYTCISSINALIPQYSSASAHSTQSCLHPSSPALVTDRQVYLISLFLHSYSSLVNAITGVGTACEI
jgi:hypothetical protein